MIKITTREGLVIEGTSLNEVTQAARLLIRGKAKEPTADVKETVLPPIKKMKRSPKPRWSVEEDEIILQAIADGTPAADLRRNKVLRLRHSKSGIGKRYWAAKAELK